MDASAPETSPRPASLPLRGLAFVIDWAIVLLLSVFIAGGGDAGDATRLPVLLVVGSIYEIGFLVTIAATPGKMALRMHVVAEDGKRLEPDRAILRGVVLLISIFVLFIGFAVSVVLALSDAKRRTLHDRLAGSIVARL